MTRLKVLASAYACNPSGAVHLHPGEDLTGWRLVEQLGRFHDLWVISHSYNKPGVESARPGGRFGSPRFLFVELPAALKWLYRIEFGQRIYYYLWQIKAWRVARKLHKEIGFDIAHHVTFGNDWIASYIGAFLPVPFVWGPVGGGQRTPKPLRSEHSLYGRFAEDTRNIAQWFGRRDPVRRRAIRRAKAVLVCNRETRDLVPERFRDKVVFFPVNGISGDDILPGPVGAREAGAFRVLTAGRLHRLKGFALAIRAFGRFASERPGARMLIIGKGPEEERLKRLIEEMGLGDSVRIQDWLPRNEVLKAMRASDAFLFPSFRDGGGAVVVEAMASGLPVICLDSGGPGSHVRAEWGIKVSPSDPDRVALEMGRALRTLHDDEGFRAALGEAARKRAAEYYRWDALGERLHEIHRSIVPDPRRSEGPSRANMRALGGRISGSMAILCPACGSTRTGLWLIKTRDLGTYPIRKCRSCRSAFVWPRPRREEIEAFYTGSHYKNVSIKEFRELDRTYYPGASMDASRLTSRCRRLSKGPRLIDIGAGFGEFSKAARDAGYDVTACEPNENSRRIFRVVNGFEPLPDMFDKDFAARYRARFDVALASHILEHVIDPAAFVADLGTILVPGGIVAVAVPHFGSLLSRLQGTKDMFMCPPEHLNFFSRRGLIGLFERNGFRTIALETVSKLNRAKIRNAGRGALRGDWAWKGIYLAMRITDRFRFGMVLNAYLRKETPRSRPAGPARFPAPRDLGE